MRVSAFQWGRSFDPIIQSAVCLYYSDINKQVVAVMVLWALCNAPRIAQPFNGHDSFGSSHYGAFGYNHLKLGLETTRGRNILAVRYDGAPIVYYSY